MLCVTEAIVEMVQATRRLKQLRALCCLSPFDSNGICVSGTIAITEFAETSISTAIAASLLICYIFFTPKSS